MTFRRVFWFAVAALSFIGLLNWDWLWNEARYEEWPHIAAIFIGIFIGTVILQWTDEWHRFPRIRKYIMIPLFWVVASAIGLGILGVILWGG